MAYSYLETSDGSLIETIDGSLIAIQVPDGDDGGCLVLEAPAARIGDPPPPGVVSPAQYSPAGLLGIPLTLLEELPEHTPVPPGDAPSVYDPVDRFAYVELVLASLQPL